MCEGRGCINKRKCGSFKIFRVTHCIMNYSGVMIIVLIITRRVVTLIKLFLILNSVICGYSGINAIQYSFQYSRINIYHPCIKSIVFIHFLKHCIFILCRCGWLPKNSLFHVSDLCPLTPYLKCLYI
jgi:hypothetical protein